MSISTAKLFKDCMQNIDPSNLLSNIGIDPNSEEGQEALNKLSQALDNMLAKADSDTNPASSSTANNVTDSLTDALNNNASNAIEAIINNSLSNSSFNLPPLNSVIEFHNNSLKPTSSSEGIFFKNRKPIMSGLAQTENADDAHYSTKQNYPNSSGFIDALGNFIKINRKTGQADIVHFSGTMIQITKSGTVNIYTKKDFQHIVEGNYYLEVKGDLGIKAKNINTYCNNSNETVTGTKKFKSSTNINSVNNVKNKFKSFKESIKKAVYKIDTFYQKSKALVVKVPTYVIKGNEKVSGRRL